MNLFIREMRATRKQLVIWGLCMIFMVAAGMGKYGTIYSTNQSMNELISQMPKSLRAIMGMGSLDLSKASGYYGMLFLYLILMASIHALMLGAGIIAKEERDKTSEFLLVKPISRPKIITVKLSAALVNILIFNLVTLISSIKMVAYYNHGHSETHDILLLMTGMFLVQLLFLSLGAGIAAIIKKPGHAASIGTVILLATFILSILIDLNPKLDSLKYMTPFKYFEAKNVLADGAVDPVFVTLSLVLTGVFTVAAYFFFHNRDINI